jgi:hypothetical protein
MDHHHKLEIGPGIIPKTSTHVLLDPHFEPGAGQDTKPLTVMAKHPNHLHKVELGTIPLVIALNMTEARWLHDGGLHLLQYICRDSHTLHLVGMLGNAKNGDLSPQEKMIKIKNIAESAQGHHVHP